MILKYLSDIVKRQSTINNILKSSSVSLLPSAQILHLLSLGFYYNRVVRGLISSALNMVNISSYQPMRIFSGALLNKKRIGSAFRISTGNSPEGSDFLKSSNISPSSHLVPPPLLNDSSALDNTFSIEGGNVHLQSIINQKKLVNNSFDNPGQEILRRTINQAFTLINPLSQSSKLSILLNDMLSIETRRRQDIDTKLIQVRKLGIDNFVNKSTSVMLPTYNMATKVLPSSVEGIGIINKFFNDSVSKNKSDISPIISNNYNLFLGKSNELLTSVPHTVARNVSDYTTNNVVRHIPSDLSSLLKRNNSLMFDGGQEQSYNSLLPSSASIENFRTPINFPSVNTAGISRNNDATAAFVIVTK